MTKVNIRTKQYWKYKVIEMEYVSMSHGDGGDKIEVCKTLHKTNSKLVFWLIILCLKLSGAKYEVVSDE